MRKSRRLVCSVRVCGWLKVSIKDRNLTYCSKDWWCASGPERAAMGLIASCTMQGRDSPYWLEIDVKGTEGSVHRFSPGRPISLPEMPTWRLGVPAIWDCSISEKPVYGSDADPEKLALELVLSWPKGYSIWSCCPELSTKEPIGYGSACGSWPPWHSPVCGSHNSNFWEDFKSWPYEYWFSSTLAQAARVEDPATLDLSMVQCGGELFGPIRWHILLEHLTVHTAHGWCQPPFL